MTDDSMRYKRVTITLDPWTYDLFQHLLKEEDRKPSNLIHKLIRDEGKRKGLDVLNIRK